MKASFKNKKTVLLVSVLFLVVVLAVGAFVWLKYHQASADTVTDTTSHVDLSKTIPLPPNAPIQFLTVDVKGTLATENDLVRVILKAKDISGNESNYLVYEDEGFWGDTNFSETGVASETKYLNQVYPIEINVYRTSGAQINVTNVQTGLESKGVSKSATEIVAAQQAQKKSDNETAIAKINQNNSAKNKKWVAGETEISLKSHQQILSMFGGDESDLDANTMKLVYYNSGVFDFSGSSQSTSSKESAVVSTQSNTGPPKIFSWRNFNGKNWISPVKNQGDFPTCWAFAAIAGLEAGVNTWYNQILNPDLSEQWAVWTHGYSAGWPTYVLDYAKSTNIGQAIPSESQYPYDPLRSNSAKPSPFLIKDGVKIQSYNGNLHINANFTDKITKMKKALIEKGPLIIAIRGWRMFQAHDLLLVGYDTSNTGETIWEMKNSWGQKWGENGYIRAIVPTNLIDNSVFYSMQPYYTSIPSNPNIQCADNDHDGYYYWGTSFAKPGVCPSSAPERIDCDDSNSAKGPRDSNDNCTALSIPLKVRLAAPANGAVIVFGKNVTLRAIATTTGPYPIQKVTFYDGTQQIGEVTKAPYNFVWHQPSDGPHSIIAQVTDTVGKTTKSAIANITMDAPPTGHVWVEASCTGPNFSGTCPHSIQASVGQKLQIYAAVGFWDWAANDTYAKNVQLYEDGKLIASTATSSSVLYNWTAGPLGTHTFAVKVTDTQGFTNASTMASSALQVIVQPSAAATATPAATATLPVL